MRNRAGPSQPRAWAWRVPGTVNRETHVPDIANTTDAASAPSKGRLFTVIAMAAILLLGLFLRVHGMKGESIWWDEFSSVVHLSAVEDWETSPQYTRWNQTVIRETAPNLLAFLKQNKTLDPATMPLYYALEYLWHTYLNRSIPFLRLLSVLIGMLIIPFVYLLGRDLYGKTAGLVAAFCLAMSPIHVQFAEEIRMYGLMTLLAVLSVYTFVHLVRDGSKRWWVLHAGASLLLFWTHPFALLVPFVEGSFWILFRFKDFRRLCLWAGMLLILLLPSAIYMSSIRFWGQEATSSWMRLPTGPELLGDMLGDDCIGMTYQLDASPDAWERIVSPEHAKAIVKARWIVGRWTVAIFVLLAAWLCGLSLWCMVRSRNGDARNPSWQWSFFLLMWWLAPPLLLYVVSVAWRPCIMPRYTVHASIAMYLMFGGAVAHLDRRSLKVLAVAVLALAYGYQQMLFVDCMYHPDWLSTASRIRSESNPDDLVLVHNWMWKRVFAYNLGPVPNIVSYSDTFDGLAEESAFFLSLDLPSKLIEGKSREVWVAIRKEYFESGPCEPFEKACAMRALAFTRDEFGGIQHVLLYHVTRDPASPPRLGQPANLDKNATTEYCDLALEFWRNQEYDTTIAVADRALAIDPKCSRAFSYKGMAFKESGRSEAALEAFREAAALSPQDYPWAYVNMGMILTDLGQYDEALAALRQGLALIPNDGWTYTCMGRAYLGKGDVDAAVAAFDKAIEFAPGDDRGHQGLQEALALKNAA